MTPNDIGTPAPFQNPFRPGAGHMPPYLAGRKKETGEFLRLLEQEVILANLVLTGLRGVGKTVLLDTWKPLAIGRGWLWVGTDLSESSSISEERIALRLITDLSVATSSIVLHSEEVQKIGFVPASTRLDQKLNYATLEALYRISPGLVADKLKAILGLVWRCLSRQGCPGMVLVYDEAQNLSGRAARSAAVHDHAPKDEYPLSLILDVFQSLQRQGMKFMLVLAGLPTLFPKLVEARTFAERMFHVVFLDRLDEAASRDAIQKPIADARCPVHLTEDEVIQIIQTSGGYPYFIQFICREVYDFFLQEPRAGQGRGAPPLPEITHKLDTDFFAGRWARATDRQRELLTVIASLENSDSEFTVLEIVERSRRASPRPFSASHVNQMLVALGEAGLVYKNRHGKYSFAVPLLGQFILRQRPAQG